MDSDYTKIMQDLQGDKEYQKEVHRIVEKEFNKIKNQYLQEFLNHPITQEIKGGIDATNTSGTLGGITNLYSFIGFDAGSDPTKPIEDLLEKSNYRIVFNNKALDSSIIFDIPTAVQIFEITPMPWAVGRSWARGIETGISGLGYYLKKTPILYPNRIDQWNVPIIFLLLGFSYFLSSFFSYRMAFHYNEIEGGIIGYIAAIGSVLAVLLLSKKIVKLPIQGTESKLFVNKYI
mgnify:CR=1 FL=1